MMKKLFVLLFFTIVALPLSAQRLHYLPQKYEYVPEHEIRVGIGAYPMMPHRENRGFYYFLEGYIWNQLLYERYDKVDYIPQEVVMTGAITATYTYRFKKWLEFGGSLSYSGFYGKLEKYGTARENSDLHCVYVLPSVRFVYYNQRYVRIYSALSLGMGMIVNTNEQKGSRPKMEVIPAYNVAFVGIAVGKRLFAYAEVSDGYLGRISVGFGYRFIK